MDEFRIKQKIKKLDRSKLKISTAVIAWVFGLDMLYVEKSIGKTIAFYMSCLFLVGTIWWIINLVMLKSRVEEINEDIDDTIIELQKELHKLDKTNNKKVV